MDLSTVLPAGSPLHAGEAGPPAAPGPRRPLTVSDLLAFSIIDDVQAQPGGPWAAYVVRSPIAGTPRYRSSLWRARPGAAAERLTSGDQRDTAPRFAPDGQRLAFLSDRADGARANVGPRAERIRSRPRTQLHLLPWTGGEAVALTDLDGTFAAPAWHPDGASLLVPFRPADPLPPGTNGDEPAAAMFRLTRLPFRADGEGLLPSQPWRILRVWLDGRPIETVTDSDEDCTRPAVSPDGRWLAYLSPRRKEHEFEESDLFVQPLDGSAPARQASDGIGSAGPAAWLTDGTGLLYCGHDGKAGDWLRRNTHVFRLDLEPFHASDHGIGRRHDLTPDLDRCVGPLVLADLQGIDWACPPPLQRADGSLVVPVSDAGCVLLCSIDPQTGVRAHVPAPGSVAAVQQLGDGTLVALTTTHTRPGELFALLPEGPHRLTHLHAWLEQVDVQEPETLWFESPDGTPIQGWLLQPDGPGPHPTIVQIHGGPMVQYGMSMHHELQWLRAQGYAVFYCNPRGSQGYGEAFVRAVLPDWGPGPMADVMAGVDLLLERGVADAARLGVTGGSYGGYLTNWIVAHTHRFSAAVTQRTVSDLADLFWDSDCGPCFAVELGGWPDESPAVYARNSPLTHVRRMRTPMLIAHSTGDERTPTAQAYRLFQALQLLGVPSEMVLFPGSSHDLSRTGPTDQRLARLRAIGEWFDRWLLPGIDRPGEA